MGSMQSPSKTIDNLEFHPFPKDRAVTGKVARCGETTVALSDKGTLFTNRTPAKKVYCAGNWDWSSEMLDCLNRLGLVTKEDKERHAKWLAKLTRIDAIKGALREAKDAKDDAAASLGAFTVRLNRAKLIALWDELGHYDQQRLAGYGHRPDGATDKPKPA
jgi:hypothetical protein